MNNIFTQVEHYMHEALQQELPEVTTTDLEKDGAVFYMNARKIFFQNFSRSNICYRKLWIFEV